MSALHQDITQGNYLVAREGLPISCEVAFTGTSVSEGVANGKVALLVSDLDAISSAPGCGPKDKMVKSKSDLAPHLVTTKKQHQSACQMSTV